VVLEVHDSNGRLAEVTALLRAAGFSRITSDQPGAMTGTDLYNVFALK
jgi:hypothetical protein